MCFAAVRLTYADVDAASHVVAFLPMSCIRVQCFRNVLPELRSVKSHEYNNQTHCGFQCCAAAGFAGCCRALSSAAIMLW